MSDEVVTRSLVRYLAVPGLAGELALITLDNGHDHTRPSTFGPGGLASLDAALDEIAAHSPAPAAIAVTGKPFVFAVGADLSGIPSIASPADAREIAETGHRVFRRLRDSAVPTFAFVNGAALGGGLELALHCHHRTIASTAVVAFPEVFLGLVPGWGGTQLLPALTGIDAAVTVIVENALAQNKTTPGPKAVQLGMADARWSGRPAWSPVRSPSPAASPTPPAGTTRSPGPGASWPPAPAGPPPVPCGPSSCSISPAPATPGSPPGRRPRTTP
jgi:enoyl-CoA hydratase/carnithine racemase